MNLPSPKSRCCKTAAKRFSSAVEAAVYDVYDRRYFVDSAKNRRS